MWWKEYRDLIGWTSYLPLVRSHVTLTKRKMAMKCIFIYILVNYWNVKAQGDNFLRYYFVVTFGSVNWCISISLKMINFSDFPQYGPKECEPSAYFSLDLTIQYKLSQMCVEMRELFYFLSKKVNICVLIWSQRYL